MGYRAAPLGPVAIRRGRDWSASIPSMAAAIWAETADPVARNRYVPVGSSMITVGNACTPNWRQVSA